MTTDLFRPTVTTGAVFSPCRTWRYRLTREWRPYDAGLVMVMLNPSTADETANDPTVERCQRRAEKMGLGWLWVVNAYALRSTDPNGLYPHHDPVGPENDAHIRAAALRVVDLGGFVVLGWGRHCDAVRAGRSAEVLDLVRHHGAVPMALKVNQDGSPVHPLYLGYDLQPVEYRAP